MPPIEPHAPLIKTFREIHDRMVAVELGFFAEGIDEKDMVKMAVAMDALSRYAETLKKACGLAVRALDPEISEIECELRMKAAQLAINERCRVHLNGRGHPMFTIDQISNDKIREMITDIWKDD